MPKKPTRSKLVKKLDTVFSQWVRLSNADNNKNCICVTCNKVFFWKEIQAGHFMSRKHYSIRWSEDNVKPQCVGCNVFKYGEQYKFSLFLGKDAAEVLYLKSKEIVKFTNYELEDKINDYSLRLKKLT
mgnify:FL=1|tara:strand:- start:725 stop:1108 length:384 start_codon:yes stop_codon:yes gene_type:complete